MNKSEKFDKLYHYTSFDAAVQIILSHSLRASKPTYTNDPFECMPHFIPHDGRAVTPNDFQTETAKYFNIISFSKTPGSSIMLSHYGRKHEGVLFEFDFNTDPFQKLSESKSGWIRPVTYNKDSKRVQFDEKEYLELLESNSDQAHEIVMKVLTTKENTWEYEREVRIFLLYAGLKNNDSKAIALNKDENPIFRFGPNSISSIYAGCRMSPQNISNLKDLIEINWGARGYDIPKIEQLELSETNFGFKQFE